MLAFQRLFGTLIALVLLFTATSVVGQFGTPWHRSPRIVVIASSPTDERIPFVREAIAYWNANLQRAGSSFRLDKFELLIQQPPDAALQEQSELVLGGRANPFNIPEALVDLPGDLRIVLGHSAFISHVGPFDQNKARTVGIRAANIPPLNLPNVARNVIAHEIGHAIGLGHNSDPTALMCGRPAACRPSDFQSSEVRFFPLLPGELEQLARMYPSDWHPKPKQ